MNEKNYTNQAEVVAQQMYKLVQRELADRASNLSQTILDAVQLDVDLWRATASEIIFQQNQETFKILREAALEAIRETTNHAVITVEEAKEIVNDVEPYLPASVTKAVQTEIEKKKTTDDKISRSDWISIIGILVTILLFFAEQTLSSEHDQKEEAYWAATNEYQQESLELQKEDIALKQEILDYFKDLQGDSFCFDDVSNSVSNSVDSQPETEEHEAVQDGQQKKPET